MRTFVAIPVSHEVRERVEGIRSQLLQVDADVKWVEPENYHLTVKFIGEVNEEELDEIVKLLQRVGRESPPFVLELQGAGFFPNRRRPRVVWIGLKGELDKAFWLGERVDAYLAELGYEMEKNRKYHLTLGRVRSEKNVQGLVGMMARIARETDFPFLEVNEIQLMQSRLSPQGPRYSVIETIRLTG